MQRESTHWIQMGPAASPAEQHALDRVRELLPEAPSTYAWANLTFIDLQGRTNELDVLVWHGGRLTVLELKGWAGSISGNEQTWRRVLPGGQVRTERNPTSSAWSQGVSSAWSEGWAAWATDGELQTPALRRKRPAGWASAWGGRVGPGCATLVG